MNDEYRFHFLEVAIYSKRDGFIASWDGPTKGICFFTWDIGAALMLDNDFVPKTPYFVPTVVLFLPPRVEILRQLANAHFSQMVLNDLP